MAGIIMPIPIPSPAPASLWFSAAFSMAMAAFIRTNLSISVIAFIRDRSSMAFCTSSGGVTEVI